MTDLFEKFQNKESEMGQKKRLKMSADQSLPSKYIFEKKEDFLDNNLSEPITDTTHVYIQKSNGTFPVKAQKARERIQTLLRCF